MSSLAHDALVRGAAVTGDFQVLPAPPAGPGWVPYPRLDDLIGHTRRAVAGASPTVSAALLATSVAAGFAAPITGALLAQRRVPIPDPAGVWLRPRFTGVDAVAVGAAALTVLDGDPLTRHPGVTSVDHIDNLRRTALDGYRALLVPLLDLIAATTRRGRRALWADAGDRLATYLLLAGRALGDQDAGRAEADALLGLATPPLRHRPDWLEFEHRGRRVVWKRRPVCCLIYQAPAWHDQYCATCPKVPAEETVVRTRAWLR